MIQIRKGVFETNSSSVHSLILGSQKDFDEWQNGDRILNIHTGDLIKLEEFEHATDKYFKGIAVTVIKQAKNRHELTDILVNKSDSIYYTYEKFMNDYDIEIFKEKEYKTNEHKKVVAMSYCRSEI